MIQFISEFKLPKEFSKKKKFDLLIGQFIPADSWKDTTKEIKWQINVDNQKVYLTIENCAKAVLESALNSGLSEKVIKDGYICITSFTYPTNALNETPLCRDPHNAPVDCNWNSDEISFNFTFRNTEWEEIHLTTLKVDTFEHVMTDENIDRVISYKFYPVVDMTKF